MTRPTGMLQRLGCGMTGMQVVGGPAFAGTLAYFRHMCSQSDTVLCSTPLDHALSPHRASAARGLLKSEKEKKTLGRTEIENCQRAGEEKTSLPAPASPLLPLATFRLGTAEVDLGKEGNLQKS